MVPSIGGLFSRALARGVSDHTTNDHENYTEHGKSSTYEQKIHYPSSRHF